MKHKSVATVVVLFLLIFGVSVAIAAGPTGALFTTTPDGTIVNENVRYESKLEVYLDGGPGPNAPQTAAGLDDGWYVFQVTDPSGKYLLSEDPSKCRIVEVEDGVITRLVNPTEFGEVDGYTPSGNGNPDPVQLAISRTAIPMTVLLVRVVGTTSITMQTMVRRPSLSS